MDFYAALTLVFVIAKLWGQVDWSWWAVLAPWWGMWVVTFFYTIYVMWVKDVDQAK